MRYPHTPGCKVAGTSEDAGEAIADHAETVRDRILAFLTAHHPNSFTADQIAAQLDQSILTVRPRVSELRRTNLIEPTAERRTNASGMRAICWRAKGGAS